MNNLKDNNSASCFLCGSIETKILIPVQCGEKISNYYKCKKCGLIFIYPKFSSEDVQHLYTKSSIINPNVKRIFISDVVNSLTRLSLISSMGFNFKDKNCLDVGCATGGLLYLIQRKGGKSYGVEPFEPFSKFASTKLNNAVYNGFFEEFEPEIKFDLITMFGVFQYFEDPELVLEKVNQLLYKDGVLIIAGVPNSNKFGRKRDFSKYYRSYLYNKTSLVYILNKNGFMINSIYSSKSDKYNNKILKLIIFILVFLRNTYSYFFNLNKIRNKEFIMSESSNDEDYDYITMICSSKVD